VRETTIYRNDIGNMNLYTSHYTFPFSPTSCLLALAEE
jgi:hypothetical protein